MNGNVIREIKERPAPDYLKPWLGILIMEPESEPHRRYNERIAALALAMRATGWPSIHAEAALKPLVGKSQHELRVFARECYPERVPPNDPSSATGREQPNA